ncbi:TIGR02679 family protein [Quadrisphaera granulorum]|uniref:TIGR02679 family protein n=1 Tax=Quadrisphaera granulorum TaxID=317664 RepID=UPI001B865508|nr:TIGR02679 family protein [Quadrisphaera granulorum]
MSGDLERLRRLLGGPDLAWLLERMRYRLEAGRPLEGTVTLRSATTAQRAAVARLFGTPLRPSTTASVRLAELEAELARSGVWSAGLEAAVVALTGPYEVRAEVLAERRAAWEAAWAPVLEVVEGHPAVGHRDALRAWWQRELATGIARRAAPTPEVAGALAEQLAGVLQRLPADGVAIGSLAHDATGSAHALDRGPLASLALRAARALVDVPAEVTDEGDREAWAAVGVVRDEVSSTVLTLALPAEPEGATGRALAAWAETGQPVVLTLRQLRFDPPAWLPPAVVRVVENPVVLSSIADQALAAGVAPPPVVCTAGWPSAAAVRLLRELRAAGWELRHHGDFDPDGVAITDWLVREVGALPWRMGAADYAEALDAGLGRAAPVGSVTASWDAELGPAMHRAQRVVEEEAVLSTLVTDALGSPTARSVRSRHSVRTSRPYPASTI